jgi:hypothetical protein
MNYYEQVRDEVERLAECTTSDAQGIIGAWEMKNGNHDMTDDENVNKAAVDGIRAEALARTILNMPEPSRNPDTRRLMLEESAREHEMELTDEHGARMGSIYLEGPDTATGEEMAFGIELVKRWNAYNTLRDALCLVDQSGPLHNGMSDANTLAIVRAALESTK